MVIFFIHNNWFKFKLNISTHSVEIQSGCFIKLVMSTQLKINYDVIEKESTIPINERLIISLYDYTGNWAKEYINNGYPVILWDKKIEGDILSDKFIKEVMCYDDYIYGILAAPPCDDFAGSGARWWEEKDKDIERIELAKALVEWVLIIKQLCTNLKFWVLENPVGRLERLIPEIKQYRKMLFHPHYYGDPYTKKTILYGEFNSNLPYDNVLPIYDNYIHNLPPTPDRKEKRSATPMGFAKAFYKSNR